MISFVRRNCCGTHGECFDRRYRKHWLRGIYDSRFSERIRTGDEVKIYTYLHVREDVMQLYGFLSRDDMKVFTLLFERKRGIPGAALGDSLGNHGG